MVQDPDFELIRRCQSPDPEIAEAAFEELFNAYSERVFNTAHRVLGKIDEASDVTQEAFVIVFRNIGQFAFEARFFTWVYRIVMNLAFDRKKKDENLPSQFSQREDADVMEDHLGADESELEAKFLRDHMDQKIRAAIDRLSPKLQEIVILRHFENQSYAQISTRLGCSLGTVKSRLSRGHRLLQEFLTPLLEQEREKA